MKKLLIATTNRGKIQELSRLLEDSSFQLVTLVDVGITDDVEEDGKTYEENSQKKALFYAKKSGFPSLADDGGIEISALNNEPGVHSKRWLGYDVGDDALIKHMLNVSANLPENNRKAIFKTVVSFATPDGKVTSAYGSVEGIIAKKPYLKLLEGYPYRSFFFLPKIGKFYHEDELSIEEEKIYNHRRLALEKLKPFMK